MTALLNLYKTGMVTTNQGSFYNTQSDELKALVSQHTAGLIADRNKYSALAFTPITDPHKFLIVRGLLATGKARDPEQDELEWDIIVETLKGIRISAVLRWFVNDIAAHNEKTGTRRLNNSRAKRLGRYLWEQASPFQVMKYAAKFKQIIVHGHIPFTVGEIEKQELHRYLTGKIKKAEDVQHSQSLKNYMKAIEGDREALKKLPFDQAQWVATEVLKIDLADYRQNTAAKSEVTTSTEKLRLHAQTGGTTEVNWRQYDLMALIRYGREHLSEWDALFSTIQSKAKSVSARLTLPNGVGVIIDNSLSMYGSSERKGYPIAFAEAIMRIFLANETPVNVWLSHDVDYVTKPLMASGDSDLRTPIAKAIAAGCKHIVIVSDGYENGSEGSVNQISKLKIVRQSGIKFHHLNPVGAAEVGGQRSLGESILPLAISGIEQISSAAMLRAFEASASAFQGYLSDIFAALESRDFGAARAIAQFKNQPVRLLGDM